jgi:hypothetical protein
VLELLITVVLRCSLAFLVFVRFDLGCVPLLLKLGVRCKSLIRNYFINERPFCKFVCRWFNSALGVQISEYASRLRIVE